MAMSKGKKVTSATLALLLMGSQAYAAIPDGTVVLKDKAYNLDYANEITNVEEIREQLIISEGKVYVATHYGEWVNNATGEAFDPTSLPAVTYKDKEGKESQYEAGNGDVILPTEPTEPSEPSVPPSPPITPVVITDVNFQAGRTYNEPHYYFVGSGTSGSNKVYGPSNSSSKPVVNGNITITGNHVKLQNLQVNGNIIINNGGVAILEGVTVSGSHGIIIQDVASNSFHANGVISPSMTITDPDGANIETDGTGSLGTITIAPSGDGVPQPIRLSGDFGNSEINVTKPAALYFAPGSIISKLVLSTPNVSLAGDLDAVGQVEPGNAHIVTESLQAAINAIDNLKFESDQLQSTEAEVVAARGKVNTAVKLGVGLGGITNLSILLKAEDQIASRAGLPQIQEIKFPGTTAVAQTGNELVVNLSQLPRTSQDFKNGSITVSKASKLTLSVKNVATIGELQLAEGSNPLTAARVSKLNLSNVNTDHVDFAAVFAALNNSQVNKTQLVNAVNFNAIMDEVLQSNVDPDDIITAHHIPDILTIINNSTDLDSTAFFQSLNLSLLMDALKHDSKITSAEKTDVKLNLAYALLAAHDEGFPLDWADANDDGQVDFSELSSFEFNRANMDLVLNALKASPETAQVAFFDTLNFSKFFGLLDKAKATTKESVLRAINYTTLFQTLSDSPADLDRVFKVVDFNQIFELITNSNIDRNAVFAAIRFNDILQAVDGAEGISGTVLEILAAIDEDNDPEVLTVQAKLETLDATPKTNDYTIRFKVKSE